MRALDRARSLLRSRFGRADGWFVELDGNVLAELDDPQWVDMFWCSYAVHVRAPEHEPTVYSDEAWNACTFVLRNRRTREIAPNAFAGGTPVIRDGRVTMRGLDLAPASPLEEVCVRVLDLFGWRGKERA